MTAPSKEPSIQEEGGGQGSLRLKMLQGLRAKGASALALLMALGFVVVAYLWEGQSPGGGVWGDGYPNGEQLIGNLKRLQVVGFKGLLFDESLYQGGIRAPGLYLYLAIWLKALGLGHQTLALGLSVALAGGGLALYGALKLGDVGSWGALLGMALFLGSAETIGNAHVPLQVGLAAGAMGISFWGLMACRRGKIWGPLALGLGLIAALMTRRQMLILSYLPCALFALPALTRLALRHTRLFLRQALALPLLALGFALLSPLFNINTYPRQVDFMWLLLALGALLMFTSPRPQEDDAYPNKSKDAALALGLAMGCAIPLPWYLATLAQSGDHLTQSGALDYLSLSYAWPLIRFEYLTMILRGLQPVAAPFIALGLIMSLTPRGRRAGALPILGLAVAAAAFFTLFHARYTFPLSLWGAALGGLSLTYLGRWGAGLALPIYLLSALRIGGWLLPLGIPTASVSANATEHIDWHEGEWRQSLKPSGRNSRPYPQLLFTLAPERDISPFPGLIQRAAAACPPDRTCGFTLLDAPPSVPFAQGGEGFFQMSYHLHYGAPGVPLQAWDRIMGTPDQVVIFLYGEGWELEHWRDVHRDVPFAVLDVFDEGPIHGLVLITLAAAPDGSIPLGWRAPPVIRWDEVIPPRP